MITPLNIDAQGCKTINVLSKRKQFKIMLSITNMGSSVGLLPESLAMSNFDWYFLEILLLVKGKFIGQCTKQIVIIIISFSFIFF